MTDPNTLIIGTRGSKLALWQANWVKNALMAAHPGLTVELCIIKTKGDKILDVPLAKVGGKGLFVKEIEEALLDGRVDLAVHSMKDMPAEIPEGLIIGAVPERELPADVLVAHTCRSLDELPHGATLGTSSLRRSAQVLACRPDLTIVPLRGNLDTRLSKLQNGEMDAIILAAAGIRRLGFGARITEVMAHDVMLPAVGQGALCIETRKNDDRVASLVGVLDDPETHVAVVAERAFLHRLEGGCQVPIAAHATLQGEEITLDGLVAAVDGSRFIRKTTTGNRADAEALGVELAEALLASGAKEILEAVTRHDIP